MAFSHTEDAHERIEELNRQITDLERQLNYERQMRKDLKKENQELKERLKKYQQGEMHSV